MSFDVSKIVFGLLFLVDVGFEGEEKGGNLINLCETGSRSSTPHKLTQANLRTGGHIRTEIIPANLGGSRLIGLGAVRDAIFGFCLQNVHGL
jgi:hypothetical protein